MPRTRFPARPHRGLSPTFLLAAACAALLVAGCATTESVQDVEGRVASVESDNAVQNQRLTDLERGSGAALAELNEQLADYRQQAEALQQQVEDMASRLRAEEGTTTVMRQKVDRQEAEVQSVVEGLERSQGELAQLRRRQQQHEEAANAQRTELLAEIDALLQHLTALQSLLQSPIGDLPSKTAADKLFRQAHGHIIDGELDLAADRFGEFIETYPDDARVPDARYRQAQVFFLSRRYDHALVASVELVEKHPDHPHAADGRWFLARSLEETGDFDLARRFYAEMIEGDSPYKADAMRRVRFLNELHPLNEDGQR